MRIRLVSLLPLRLRLLTKHLAPEVRVLEVKCLLSTILCHEARLREGALAYLLLCRGGAPLQHLLDALGGEALDLRVVG